MPLSITNNIASINAQNNLTRTSGLLNKSLERLSSGLKVNRGADGPAALVVSEEQRAQIAGLQAAIGNTNKAVSLVQTGEGALGEINSLLTKIRSLAVDSANSGVNDANSLAANQAEIKNALQTITQIANQAQFGNKKLLDGSAGVQVSSAPAGVSVAASPNSGAVSGTYTLAVQAAAVKANVAGTTVAFTGSQSAVLTINGVDITLNANNAGTQNDLINTINTFSGQTGVVASIDNASGDTVLASKVYGSQGNFDVESSGANAANVSDLDGTTTNGEDVEIDVTLPNGNDIDVFGIGNTAFVAGLAITLQDDPATPFTTVDSGVADGDIIVQNNSLTFQIGANAGQTATIGLGDVRAAALGQGVAGAQFTNLSLIDVTSASGAQDSIRVVDQAISDVANLRGQLGAFQANTLESNANNLRTALENTTAAESTIRDTDFAAEIANYTKFQVQLQAGTSVLGNANQIAQLVASLLRG